VAASPILRRSIASPSSEFSGIVLPSSIESRRPILFVGPDTFDVHLLCLRAERLLYKRIEPGDSEGFAAALEYFADQDISSLGRLDSVRA
jgi:hypothetical protein